MSRENVNDLVAFLAVARERSFTRAAAKIGISQSALSHTLRQLEARLGVRLLTRTTRAVSPTEAGERLLEGVGPLFDEIEIQVDALSALRDKPAGTIRITTSDHPLRCILWPKLTSFLRQYPDVNVEMIFDNSLKDIVQDRLDAGIRLGEQVAKDMISVRISPDIRFAVVGAPSYFIGRTEPQRPEDLVQHCCINLRLPTYGGLWAWEFEEDGREIKVRVEGQVTFNNIYDIRDAAIDGFGLAYVPEDIAAPDITDGRLKRVLEPFCPYWEGYHIYYPSRRQSSPAFVALIDALRHRH
ncbi:LysR family transcriptional regulator [Rhizobium sp. BK602]|uniref:LysR family transcriptional regulator n=1 Tax=Rhizobium sp. BK602 TaxID=2586986 RepID=UPI00161FAA96|nr:LysR family transcriptional regulator [Rhizobium sp. BK602]MBB3610586.1 DNA-binding transcriptional LysR family regulator [Rhizobium sp. BK602]